MQSASKSQADDNKIQQYISFDESLYDLMCSLIGFEFATENDEFNSVILGDSMNQRCTMNQGDSIEITYCSNNEKNNFLYYLLVEILYTNFKNANEAGPIIEVVLFDNFGTLDILALHRLLLRKLSMIEEDQERVDIAKDLMKKLLIYRPHTKKDFLLNLKSVWTVLDKNKFLRVVMIDSVNSFQFFEDNYKKADFDNNKDKKRMSVNAKKNFNKEMNARIQENIYKLVTNEKLCTVLFKREYFKMNDCIAWG